MTETEIMQGLDYCVKLTYSATDKSDLSVQEKRNILYSAYCFRCIFDNDELKRASNALIKNGVSFVYKDKPSGEGVVEIDAGDKTAYKIDVGSPAYAEAVKSGAITGEFAVMPEKLTLFELVLAAVSLNTATAELKANWFINLPFLFYLGAPVEFDLFEEIKKKVYSDEVFNLVLESKYSDNIYYCREEMIDEHPLVADWYTPFIDWKNELTEKGVSRITEFVQKKLALGDYKYVMDTTERLLDCFPDDEEILLLNVAGRMSLCASVDFETRVKMLGENFKIVNEAIMNKAKKYVYFLYYRGLTRLGMQDPGNAEADFRSCVELDPKFEPAIMMLRGMEHAVPPAGEKECAGCHNQGDHDCDGNCASCSEDCSDRK